MLHPFTQWVGGKHNLVHVLTKCAPHHFCTYYEPFVGAGTLLFALHPKHAIINDYNRQLITAYRAVANHPRALLKLLKEHFKHNSKRYYLAIRHWDHSPKFYSRSDTSIAARLIYLLAFDYNALYRVNSKGEFNVPYGDRNKSYAKYAIDIKQDSRYLARNHVRIKCGDFAGVLASVKKGDFVYFDPPYIPLNSTSNFTRYTERGFNVYDQARLSNLFFALSHRGAKVLLSNSDTRLTRALYRGAKMHIITNNYSVSNSNEVTDTHVHELLISNYPIHTHRHQQLSLFNFI